MHCIYDITIIILTIYRVILLLRVLLRVELTQKQCQRSYRGSDVMSVNIIYLGQIPSLWIRTLRVMEAAVAAIVNEINKLGLRMAPQKIEAL